MSSVHSISRRTLFLAAGAGALGLTACASGTSSQTTGASAGNGAASASAKKMVLLLPGPINDQSWNATNYAGLKKANKQLGTNMEYVESVQAADFTSTMKQYCERKYDLIMAAGTQFDEAANAVAKSYPNTRFCVVNGMTSKGANVSPIFPKEFEASYLAGIIAGEVSKKGQFGTIGGFPNVAMEHLLDVYEKVAVDGATARGLTGAKATRAYANSWDNVSLGKQMAETMINNGVDTLFVYANQVGLGSIQGAKEKGAQFIGFSSDQNSTAPGTIPASIVFDFETFYVWAIAKFLKNDLAGNTVHEAGIKENIFKASYTDAIGQPIKDKVQAGIDSVKTGKIDLTSMFKKK